MDIDAGLPQQRLRTGRQRLSRHPGRQRGVIAMLFAVLLIVILACMGLALDLGRVINRKAELQTVADVGALAAANELNGTADGIAKARARAAAAVPALKSLYDSTPAPWSDAALRFSSAASGGTWLDSAAAAANPAGLLYAKIDTGELSTTLGAVSTYFMRIITPAAAEINTTATAVAGRFTVRAIPLGICAMSPDAAKQRQVKNELVEYGFRRGVGYDLMQLNPHGDTPENFLINPMAASSASITAMEIAGPATCTGTMPMSQIVGANVRVTRSFPLGDLHEQLNSRFANYANNLCIVTSAPPDSNVTEFTPSTASWMMATPASQSAQSLKISLPATRLHTVADPDPLQETATPRYGVLWTFAGPVAYSAYSAGVPEPAAGYARIPTSEWKDLYHPAAAAPSATYAVPYKNIVKLPPSTYKRGVEERRVLHVPLLDCEAPIGNNTQAKVLAVGRFFMTVPATSTSIYAEFAGVAVNQTLGAAALIQ